MNNNPITLDKFPINQAYRLDTCEGFPKPASHFFEKKEVIAVLSAKAINRPLLVRGEPGCGKTQLARAVAQFLKMPLAKLVVNERTEMEDLFWHYDALRRLSDANSPNGVQNEKKYLSAGPLWWALHPQGGDNSAENYAGSRSNKPDMGAGKQKRDFNNGVLLLIDEIDKADRSVPNSLLDALDNYSFDVPYIRQRIHCEAIEKPLIIITSNSEQALPPAFVRRCLVLDIDLPDDDKAFVETLEKRGKALLPDKLEPETYRDIAKQLLAKRKKLADEPWKPGQAEYLDHLHAIVAMKQFDPDVKEEDACKELENLFYEKQQG